MSHSCVRAERRSGGECAARWLRTLTALPVAGLLLACGQEGPTDVGGGVLPSIEVCTFEQEIPASAFLVSDTAFRGAMRPPDAPFVTIAKDFRGGFTANTLMRFRPAPTAIFYTDPLGSTRTDSLHTYVGGSLVMWFDTVRIDAPDTVRLQVLRTDEDWDPVTANWNLRVDSVGVQHAWRDPGGSAGDLIGEAVWAGPQDSVVVTLDSATVAAWQDTTDASRGALVAMDTEDARVRVRLAMLRLSARPSEIPDTLVTLNVDAQATTFVYDPAQPVTGALQAAGLPSWRSMLEFRPRLDTLTLQDPQGRAHCTARLGDATINSAKLVLQPIDVPEAFLPEDSLRFEVFTVIQPDGVPLSRAPLGERMGSMPERIAGGTFAPDAAPDPIAVPVTRFLNRLVLDAEASRHLALMAVPETGTVGIAAFSRMGGPAAPRLRVTVTVAPDARF